MSKLRWGILSTAGIAQKALIPAFQRADNAKVTAIASGSGLEKAKETAEKFEIEKSYGSYEELLDDPEIDAVYIPLPNHLHKKWVTEAARKGKHILCEKPAALNTEEVLEMKKACAENDVLFMEAFMYYFHPQHERVKEIIDSGEIGEVKYIQAGFAFHLKDKDSNIRMSNEKGGGSIYDIGCYPIHSIRNILGMEPERVHVHAITDSVYKVDTDVVAYMQFPKGVRASFDSSFSYAMRNEYVVYGTKGKITVPRAYRPDLNGGDGVITVEKPNNTRTETINADQYKIEVEHISEVILKGESKLEHDFDNTIKNMRVIDACYDSIRRNSEVKLAKASF